MSLNGSSTSLLFSAPVLTVPYISVISLASVVGTFGNLLVIGSFGGSVRCRNPKTVGKIFIVNLACSDLIVTSVINPMAIAGIPWRTTLQTNNYSPRMYSRRIIEIIYGPKERPSRIRLTPLKVNRFG